MTILCYLMLSERLLNGDIVKFFNKNLSKMNQEYFSSETLDLMPKKAIRVILENLGDIGPSVDTDPEIAKNLRIEVVGIIEDIVRGYQGKHSQVPTFYLSRRALDEAKEFESCGRHDVADYLESIGDQLEEVSGKHLI